MRSVLIRTEQDRLTSEDLDRACPAACEMIVTPERQELADDLKVRHGWWVLIRTLDRACPAACEMTWNHPTTDEWALFLGRLLLVDPDMRVRLGR
jgi:hypothetical protein